MTGPLPWKALTKTRIRTPLPLDDLVYLVLPFVPSTGTLQSRLSHLVPTDYPPHENVPVPWAALKTKVGLALLEHWANMSLPAYYQFVPSARRHRFMGLPKFLAGRIPQMRSGKS